MLTKTKILVVDDEKIVRDSLCEWLRADGYEVDSVDGGEHAINKVSKVNYDVIFVDLKMPDIDGITTMTEIKNIKQNVVFVILTTYATLDTAIYAMKKGAYDYLIKPFNRNEISILVSRINEYRNLLKEIINLKKLQKSYSTKVEKSNKVDKSFSVSLSLDSVEKIHIENVLSTNNWNIKYSSEVLGIDRTTLYSKIKKYSIERKQKVLKKRVNLCGNIQHSKQL